MYTTVLNNNIAHFDWFMCTYIFRYLYKFLYAHIGTIDYKEYTIFTDGDVFLGKM